MSKLTDSEKAICRLIVEGLSNEEIALYRACSKATVKKHIQRIYNKLGCHKRTRIWEFKEEFKR